jgi:hypothetical protein
MSIFNLTVVLSASALNIASCGAEPAAAASTQPTASRAATSPEPGDLIGAWKISDKKLVVDVRESGETFVGVVTDAPVNRLIGKAMFKDVAFDAASGTYSGQVLAVRRKEYVAAVFSVRGDTMTLRAGEGGDSKTVQWNRQAAR